MSKHSERIEKLAVKERRTRAMSRLVSDEVAGATLRQRANALAAEAEVLAGSVRKRAAAHRGERKSPKRGSLREYNTLKMEVAHLGAAARASDDPCAVQTHGVKIVVRLMGLAQTLGIKASERPSAEQMLAEVDMVVRVRMENSPEKVETRKRLIALHKQRDQRCWCIVCRYVHSKEMTVDGRYIDAKLKRRRTW